MAQYQIIVDGSTVRGLLTRDDGLARLVEQVVNQILEAQLAEQLKAAPYERGRTAGLPEWSQGQDETTRIGRLVLSVPRARSSALSTEMFERYQRSRRWP